MANNRLYIRCKQCGELCFLGKHFGKHWDFDKNIQGAVLEKFFVDHCFCDESIYPQQPFNSFELVTQFGQGFPKILTFRKRTNFNGEKVDFCLDEDLNFSEEKHKQDNGEE